MLSLPAHVLRQQLQGLLSISVQHFDVIIVGAGFGGIGAAIQLKRLGYDKIVIVDREDDLGGTWHVNHYPGLSVDQPSPTFSYWFEPNPYWSRMYAPGSELKRYAEYVADKYDLRRHMRFNTTVEGARWDDDAKLWRVALAGGETLSAQFVIAATGFLCQPKTPDIEGIDTFAGRIIHTAKWDDSYSLAGRRAAVIGTGSTGVQVVPGAGQGSRRANRLSAHADLGHAQVRCGVPARGATAVRQGAAHPARGAVVHRRQPGIHDGRHDVELPALQMGQQGHSSALQGLSAALGARSRVVTKAQPGFRLRLQAADDLQRLLPGVRQAPRTSGNQWIERIEPDGIVASDGTKRLIDTLVLATGFDVWEANLPAIEVIGREGRDLGKWWRETQFQAYEGISVPYFPNFLTMASPYAWVGLSWFNTVEYQMRHMDRLFGELQRRGGSHLRGHRAGQRPVPGSSDRHCSKTRLLHSATVRPRGRTGSGTTPARGSAALPADVGAQRRQGAGAIPVVGLCNCLTAIA